jgi:hypothetical protein
VGTDEIQNGILRNYAFALYLNLFAIFNFHASLQLGIVPRFWKTANVIMLPKIHPPVYIEKNLWLISLTPNLSEILEALLGSWMLEKNIGQIL